jgi:hypothetical protein
MKRRLIAMVAVTFVFATFAFSLAIQNQAHALTCSGVPKAKLSESPNGDAVGATVTSNPCNNAVEAWAFCLDGHYYFGQKVYSVSATSIASCSSGINKTHYGYRYHKDGEWHNG